MKKVLLLCAVVLTFAAPSAHAALNLSWNDCFGNAGALPTISFDCAAGGPYKLIGSFQTLGAVTNAFAMDVTLDFNLEGQTSLPPFWHFESGGCNETGLGLSIDRSASGTCATGNSTMWGPAGTLGTGFLTGYSTGVNGPNRGRQNLSIARDATSPVNVAGPPTKYYAFTLSFFMDNSVQNGSGNNCIGCPNPVDIVWNKMILYNTTGAPANELTCLDTGSMCCASANGGGAQCTATPARARTWGAVKSLYR